VQQTYESWHESNTNQTPAETPAAPVQAAPPDPTAAQLTAPVNPPAATSVLPGQNSPAPQATTVVLKPAARVATMVFGIVSACYFGLIVFQNISGWLAGAMNSVSTTSSTVKHAWTAAEIGDTIITVVAFFCFIILTWASMRLVKFDKDGRRTWLKTSAVTGGILLLSIGASIWRIHTLLQLKYIVNPSFASGLIAIMIAVSIVPIAIFVIGWILLTRKSVRDWFS
jgi:hypothetical protein